MEMAAIAYTISRQRVQDGDVEQPYSDLRKAIAEIKKLILKSGCKYRKDNMLMTNSTMVPRVRANARPIKMRDSR